MAIENDSAQSKVEKSPWIIGLPVILGVIGGIIVALIKDFDLTVKQQIWLIIVDVFLILTLLIAIKFPISKIFLPISAVIGILAGILVGIITTSSVPLHFGNTSKIDQELHITTVDGKKVNLGTHTVLINKRMAVVCGSASGFNNGDQLILQKKVGGEWQYCSTEQVESGSWESDSAIDFSFPTDEKQISIRIYSKANQTIKSKEVYVEPPR